MNQITSEPQKSLSILVPCHDEESVITATTNSIWEYCKSLPDKYSSSFEIILVNDGSTDATLELINDLIEARSEVRLVSFVVNRGRGAALRAGFNASRGSIVTVLDADLSYSVDHIGKIIAAFELDQAADVVIISPYMKGGVVSGVPLKRLVVSRIANKILAGFVEGNFSTVTGIVRGYRGSRIRSLPLLENGKEIHLEILRKMSLTGAKIIEIPGRLIWSAERACQRHSLGRKFASTATRHLTYALLTRPAKLFQYSSIVLIVLGLYELLVITISTFSFFSQDDLPFFRRLWIAMNEAYTLSPHSFYIAGLALILGTQHFLMFALQSINKLQHEETVRHLIEISSQIERAKHSSSRDL
ncbi:MAG: glycosyltransferase family 2 protein [Bdellovibrionota bacterium]|nr:MAG: glycosyltransferase family 2 protein [Bdellovibrionota bacterium]